MIEPSEAVKGTTGAQRLAAAYDRTRALISMVFTGAFTLLMALVTFRVAMAGEWYGAAVAAVLAAGLGFATVKWYRRMRE
jgi:hypothetical protein